MEWNADAFACGKKALWEHIYCTNKSQVCQALKWLKHHVKWKRLSNHQTDLFFSHYCQILTVFHVSKIISAYVIIALFVWLLWKVTYWYVWWRVPSEECALWLVELLPVSCSPHIHVKVSNRATRLSELKTYCSYDLILAKIWMARERQPTLSFSSSSK